MSMLPISYEEIIKCLKLEIKTSDCEVLLWDEDAINIMKENHNTVIEGLKKTTGDFLDAKRKYIETKTQYKMRLDEFKAKNSTVTNYEQDFINSNTTKNDAIENEKTTQKSQEELYTAAIASPLRYKDRSDKNMWKEENNYKTLLELANKKDVGHMPGNFTDRREAPSACCWDSSPEIKVECEKKLNDKINKFKKYDEAKTAWETAKTELKNAETTFTKTKLQYEDEKRNLNVLEQEKGNAKEKYDSSGETLKIKKIELDQITEQEKLDAWALEELYKFNNQPTPDIDRPVGVIDVDSHIIDTNNLMEHDEL
jgi:FtsZ-binding cell division protein ZapB